MSDLLQDLAFGYDRDLPFEATREMGQAGETFNTERFEITSRNDQRVPGLLLYDPRHEGPRPLILVGHPGTLDRLPITSCGRRSSGSAAGRSAPRSTRRATATGRSSRSR